jgi:predicted PurR-regulated permease PerM
MQGSEKYFFIAVAVVSLVVAFILVRPVLNVVAVAVVIAVLISMVAQGATMTFFLGIAGMRYLFFWFMLCTVLAILPPGNGLIAFPLGIFLILTGHTWQGLVVILGYVLLTANVAPVVQATIVPKEATADPAPTLLAIFGGFILLGVPGGSMG